MLDCALSFVVAAYPTVHLILQDVRALPQGTFYKAVLYRTFFDFIKNVRCLKPPCVRVAAEPAEFYSRGCSVPSELIELSVLRTGDSAHFN
jgi:hypothetical protein